MKQDDEIERTLERALSLATIAGAGELAAAAAQPKAVGQTLAALLGHELAVGHRLMMRLAARVDATIDRMEALEGPDDRAGVEAARLAAVVARLMERYRVGVLALHKLRGKDGIIEKYVGLYWAKPDDEDPPPGGGSGGSGGGGGGGSSAGDGRSWAESAAVADDPYGRGAASAAAPAAAARPGRLRNGNPSGDLASVARCGARTRAGGACRQPAMANGRCRMHGGGCRGPATEAGRARARRARLVHGGRSAEAIGLRGAAAACGRRLGSLLDAASAAAGPSPGERPAGHGVDRSDCAPGRRRPAGRRPEDRLGGLERDVAGPRAALDGDGGQALDAEMVADQLEQPRFLLADLAVGSGNVAGERVGGLVQLGRQRPLDRVEDAVEPVGLAEQLDAGPRVVGELLEIIAVEHRQVAHDVADGAGLGVRHVLVGGGHQHHRMNQRGMRGDHREVLRGSGVGNRGSGMRRQALGAALIHDRPPTPASQALRSP
jgi:hypothetical protein